MTSKEISSEFPFKSKFIEINGSNIHYIEAGTGDPIVFIHGNPHLIGSELAQWYKGLA
jgi:haloalkane dehalogenase